MQFPTAAVPNLPKTDHLYLTQNDIYVAKCTQRQLYFHLLKLQDTNRHLQSSSSRLSPLPRTEHYRLHSPSSRTNSAAGSSRSHDDDYVDIVHERQRNWNSPRPIWHRPPSSSSLPKGRASPSFSASSLSPPPTTNGRIKTNSSRTSNSNRLNEHHHDHHSHTGISHISNFTKEREQPSRPSPISSNEQPSPTPSRTSSLQAINNTHHTDELNLGLASPSPPLSISKERNGFPSISVKIPASSRKQESPRNEDSVRDRDMDSDGMFLVR